MVKLALVAIMAEKPRLHPNFICPSICQTRLHVPETSVRQTTIQGRRTIEVRNFSGVYEIGKAKINSDTDIETEKGPDAGIRGMSFKPQILRVTKI